LTIYSSMKKLNRETLKQLILETITPNPNLGGAKMFTPTLGVGQNIRNYPSGEAPNNHNKEPMFTREAYETGDVETHIKGGETYVTQGGNVYKLVFTNEDLTAGVVQPVGQHGFHIIDGRIEWHGKTPMNVKNDADLEKQILDYSGRE
jgi:hypothetical protein